MLLIGADYSWSSATISSMAGGRSVNRWTEKQLLHHWALAKRSIRFTSRNKKFNQHHAFITVTHANST